MSRHVKKVLSHIRAAADQYNMIDEGDKIAIGVSGGKDSLVLLYALNVLRGFYPKKFDITAVSVDPFFNNKPTDFSKVENLCNNLGVKYIVKETELWDVVFNKRAEKNPCSLCARMRRGILHQTCNDLGCNKIALGHHKNDVSETFMMNLLNGGTIGCFSPKSYLSKRDIHMIRPMVFLEEKTIVSACTSLNLPVVKSACTVDGKTERENVKIFLKEIGRKYDNI